LPPPNGSAIFRGNCAVCHGTNGEGGYGANLQASTLSRPEIINVVTNGRDAMEAWGGILDPDEIEAVARYVKNLQK
jgi:cytochrome c oxidase subunit 2